MPKTSRGRGGASTLTMVTTEGGAQEASLARPQLHSTGFLQLPALSCDPAGAGTGGWSEVRRMIIHHSLAPAPHSPSPPPARTTTWPQK